MSNCVFDSVVELSAGEWEREAYPEYNLLSERELSTTTPFCGFRVGDCIYEFLRSQTLRFVSTETAAWRCSIDSLSEYSAQAQTQEEAFNELMLVIHTEFQRLLAKRPFEMNEDERRFWKRLANTVDLLTYKLRKPLEFIESGCVSFGKIARPSRVKWIDGSNYKIDIDQVPGELMACAPGQWIECVVLRDRVTKHICKIKSFRKISMRIPTEAQVSASWEKVPPGDFEDVDWE